MKRNIIGEGSYGCVHKPSLHCNVNPSPNFDYKNYVSKIMKTKHAKEELSEFVILKNIDPTEEYHLGKPILCKPKLDDIDVKLDISKCNHIKIENIEADPDNYSLLVLKYGGPDLKVFSYTFLNAYLKIDKEQRVDAFWLEVHHLIKGLKFFKTNGLVHNDIKPQNILFNLSNGQMRYIDFGLMRTKKDIIESSKTNKNYLGIYHWSYPMDCGFMDKQQFNNYYHRNSSRRTIWQNQLSELIVTNSNVNTLNLPINSPESFSILYTYLNPTYTVPNAATQYGYINSFFDGFNDLIKNNSYANVLNHTTDSIDVFGLGFTLQFMANSFKRLNAMSLENYTRLSAFFHKMYDFNPITRVIDIDLLLSEYENILLEIGILTKVGKSFENNILINKVSVPPSIINKSKSDEKSKPKHLSVALQKMADKDAINIVVNCGNDKELNPISKRCVNKCKTGFNRNDKFQCKKKTQKNIRPSHSGQPSRTKQLIKFCPSDKELNPVSKRCVNKCKPGFNRNDKFQCRKKTKKIY